jgi:hypothetical protein
LPKGSRRVRAQLHRLRKNSDGRGKACQGTTSQLAEKVLSAMRRVSGHEFTRAVRFAKSIRASAPAESFSPRSALNSIFSASCSVGPQKPKLRDPGFSPCGLSRPRNRSYKFFRSPTSQARGAHPRHGRKTIDAGLAARQTCTKIVAKPAHHSGLSSICRILPMWKTALDLPPTTIES